MLDHHHWRQTSSGILHCLTKATRSIKFQPPEGAPKSLIKVTYQKATIKPKMKGTSSRLATQFHLSIVVLPAASEEGHHHFLDFSFMRLCFPALPASVLEHCSCLLRFVASTFENCELMPAVLASLLSQHQAEAATEILLHLYGLIPNLHSSGMWVSFGLYRALQRQLR